MNVPSKNNIEVSRIVLVARKAVTNSKTVAKKDASIKDIQEDLGAGISILSDP